MEKVYLTKVQIAYLADLVDVDKEKRLANSSRLDFLSEGWLNKLPLGGKKLNTEELHHEMDMHLIDTSDALEGARPVDPSDC